MKTVRTMSLALTTLALSALAGTARAQVAGTFTVITGGQPVNLTTLGTTDWAQWGYGGTNTGGDPGQFNQKTGSSLISNYSAMNGANTFANGTDGSYPAFSWTDGSPTAAATDTGQGIAGFYTGSQTNYGVSFTVNPTAPGVLNVYVGGFNINGSFTATQGTSTYTDTSFSSPNGEKSGDYALAFSGTAPITISWVAASIANSNNQYAQYSNPILFAAALAPVPAPEPSAAVSLTLGALVLCGLTLHTRRRSAA